MPYVQDSTTIAIWWRTGTFDADDTLSVANLIFTIFSGCAALLATLYAVYRVASLKP